MITKAICGVCNHYGLAKTDPQVKKGNPWRCIAVRQCQKRAYG